MHGVISGATNMARNSEKRLSGLNRFLEAKETSEHSMSHLNTLSFQCYSLQREMQSCRGLHW